MARKRFIARISIPGTGTRIKFGPVSADVTINVARDIDLVSVIGAASVEELKFEVESSAFAGINASSVMVGVDHPECFAARAGHAGTKVESPLRLLPCLAELQPA